MIGILGGTFDPPHLAHLILAEEAVHRLELTAVLWVPTAEPPHKPDQPITPIEHRLRMVELAIAGNPAFAVSRVDIDRPGPHYSVDTVTIIKGEYAQVAFLMGADSLDQILSWHRPRDLVNACSALAVMKRPGVDPNLEELDEQLPGLQAKLQVLEAPMVDISSQAIRRRIREAHPHRYVLPQRVVEYIHSERLYR